SLSVCASGCGGDFQVARVGLCAVAAGTATLHWQFSPPFPANRNTGIVDSNCTGNATHDPALFTDYVINVVTGPGTPTRTPTPGNSPTATNTPTPAGTVCSYVVTQTTGVPIIPGVTDTGNHTDDGVTSVTLPFVYSLYSAPFSTVNVSSNGNLQF